MSEKKHSVVMYRWRNFVVGGLCWVFVLGCTTGGSLEFLCCVGISTSWGGSLES